MCPARRSSVRSTPRSERAPAILAACVELLTEIGYERMTIDAVAARAKASKATIYRRWRNKGDLAAEALRFYADSDSITVVDTGDLRADLIDLMRSVRSKFLGTWPLLAGLIHAMQDDPELARLMRAEISHSKDGLLRLLESRLAGAGGRLPDTELIQEILPGQIVMRLLIGEPVDDAYLTRLVDAILLPLVQAHVTLPTDHRTPAATDA